MSLYIKKFGLHTQYEHYITGNTTVLPNVSYCEDVKDVHINPWTWADEYFTTVALEDGTISFTPTESNVISYSIDKGKTWVTENTVEVRSGDSVMWKGMMTHSEFEGIGNFSATTCNFDVQGNIMSLIYGDGFKNQLSLEGKHDCFMLLFNESKVVSAKDLVLPATTLEDNCYGSMFNMCRRFTSAPQLLATTLANFCYNGMFMACTSLTTAPELPATTLAEGCYLSMFLECTSLTTAPQLTATILANSCYDGMFRGCTSLTSAPQLPATTLVQSCYDSMFKGCTSLNYIKAMFTTTPSTTYTDDWVNGVAASGTFVKNSAAQWDVSGNDGVPTGWTIQTA